MGETDPMERWKSGQNREAMGLGPKVVVPVSVDARLHASLCRMARKAKMPLAALVREKLMRISLDEEIGDRDTT